MEHDIFKVTSNAHSSNNGDVPTFIFCRAYCITSINNESPKDH